MKISIVVPFFNEEENVKDTLNYLNKEIDNDRKYEIVFVNDGSIDQTESLIKKTKNLKFKYKIVTLSKNYGSHAAIRAGIKESTYDNVTVFSFDLQEPFSVIKNMQEKIKEGYDLVFAYKEVQKRSKLGLFFSKKYAKLMQKYVNKDFPLEGINNFMITKKIKELLNENIEANSSIFLQILDLGFNKTFVPYSLIKRKKGKSKWTLTKKVKLLIDSFVSYSFFPIRLVSKVGILLCLLGGLFALYILVIKLLGSNMPIGYPTLIILILLGFGSTNIMLGIIAEYLWRDLDASRNRPVFIIDKVYEEEQK